MTTHSPALDISEEAQDLILDYIRGDSPCAPSLARTTFASFCLVSRKWLNSGRRALYYDPLAVQVTSWERATKLQQALESNEMLGRAVRSLETLDVNVRQLGEMSHMRPKGAKMHAACKWGRKMVKLSPSARRVGLSLCNLSHALKLAKDLSPLLTYLNLYPITSRPFHSLETQALLEAAAPSLSNLAELSLQQLQWPPDQGKELGPQLPFPIHTLSFSDCALSLPQLLTFVPSDPSTLRSLSIATRISLTQADTILLLSAVGAHLTSFHFTSLWSDASPILSTEYGERDGHSLPIDLLSPLPNLQSLKLEGTTGMTPKKLETVLEHSPKLEQLDLSQSTWSFVKPPFTLSPEEAFLGDKGKIETMLEGAREALRKVDLGLMPLIERADEEWPELRAVAERRSLDLAFEFCQDPTDFFRCMDCQSLHPKHYHED